MGKSQVRIRAFEGTDAAARFLVFGNYSQLKCSDRYAKEFTAFIGFGKTGSARHPWNPRPAVADANVTALQGEG